jgi:hypothetical protein
VPDTEVAPYYAQRVMGLERQEVRAKGYSAK